MKFWVCHAEGGNYVYPPTVAEWCAEAKVRPIWGVRSGPFELVYDSILKRLGHRPWRFYLFGWMLSEHRRRLAQRVQRLLSILDGISA